MGRVGNAPPRKVLSLDPPRQEAAADRRGQLAAHRAGDGPCAGRYVMTPRGSLLHWLRAIARNTFRRERSDNELRAEIDSYVELLTDEKRSAGLPPEAGRRAALLEFGSVEAVTEETRGVRAGALLEQCWRDARYA